MKLENIKRVDELSNFLGGTQPIAFAIASNKKERYQEISKILSRFSYHNLGRKDKGIVIKFLLKISGYSSQQLERLISQHKSCGKLMPKQKTLNGFERKYTDSDILTLASEWIYG
jgi:F0F1-type ATP synthase beta subunit